MVDDSQTTEILTIKLQERLSLARQLEITVYGIHHRLWRSMLTLGVVIVAVAFLMNILTESTISNALKRGVWAQAEQERQLSRLATMLEVELDRDSLRQSIASMPDSRWPLAALQDRLGLSEDDLTAIHADSRASVRYATWYAGVRPGHLRQLFDNRSLDETYAVLATADSQEELVEKAREIPLRLPKGFVEFAAGYPEFQARLESLATKLTVLRAEATTMTGGATVTEWLVSGGGATRQAELAALGLALPEEAWQALHNQASANAEEAWLNSQLQRPQVMREWSATFDERFLKEQVLARLATDAEAASLVLASRPEGADRQVSRDDVSSDDVSRIARTMADRRALMNLSSELRLKYGNHVGLDPITLWLMVVSLLVCAAGISNAMLVNVLERFREIATMKCLGALNGFIATIFLFEAFFLGLVGGVLGALMGAVIGVVRMVFSYGSQATTYFSLTDLLAPAAICLACGIGLTVIAALYPAFSAARMAPMEAMRID